MEQREAEMAGMSWKPKQLFSTIQDVTEVSVLIVNRFCWQKVCVTSQSGFWILIPTILSVTRLAWPRRENSPRGNTCCLLPLLEAIPSPTSGSQVTQQQTLFYSNGGFSKQLCLNNSNTGWIKTTIQWVLFCLFFKWLRNNGQRLQMQQKQPTLSTQPPLFLFQKPQIMITGGFLFWGKHHTCWARCLLAHHDVSDWPFPHRQCCKNKVAKQKLCIRKLEHTDIHFWWLPACGEPQGASPKTHKDQKRSWLHV